MLKRQKTFLLENAKLYLVGVPIGNYKDITFRAIETLSMVDAIYCEDTRVTGLLLNHFDIKTKMYSYHIHNEQELTSTILERVKNGENIAIVSDAGMPSISDPGYFAVAQAIKNDVEVCVIPGVCAGIMALVASGITSNNFTFIGFLNSKESKRQEELENLKFKDETLILYEAPHRIKSTLQLIDKVMPDRQIVLARELTKKYEEYLRGTAKEILEVEDELKGEMVVVISGCSEEEKFAKLLSMSIKEHYCYYRDTIGLSDKESQKMVAKIRHLSSSEIYKEIKGKNKHTDYNE